MAAGEYWTLDRREVRSRCQAEVKHTVSPVTPRFVPKMPHREALRQLRILTIFRKGLPSEVRARERRHASGYARIREAMNEAELTRDAIEAAITRRTRIAA